MVYDGPPYAPSNDGHAVGASPGGDNAHLLALELNEEEQELWRQLRRKRDFESRVVDKRAQLQELRDRRRKVSGHHVEVHASVEHLKEEKKFAEEQEAEVKHDILVLTEANREIQQTQTQQAAQAAGLLYGNHRDPTAILAEEKHRQEEIELQHAEIRRLRGHLEKMREEKERMQHKQRILFEKQRSAEQDRNRLLGTLQDDRSAINEVRQERIRLWEARSRMEQEIAKVIHEAHLDATGPGPTFADGTAVLDAVGGLRTSVQDTTADGPGLAPSTYTGSQYQSSKRPMQQLNSSAWDASGYPGAGSLGDPRTDPLARGPGGPSDFSSRQRGDSATGVGCTEWSEKLGGGYGGGAY